MNIENFSSEAAATGGGFIGGLLLGYALKKVVKLIAVIVGLFIAGLSISTVPTISFFNWDKIEGTISTLANTTTNTFNNYNAGSLVMTSFGIPPTGGMSAGFAIGLMKG